MPGAEMAVPSALPSPVAAGQFTRPPAFPPTIYKTLDFLKDLDEVLELGLSDDDNRYDGNKPDFPVSG
jgi:Fe2+ or Zn2+ uptake regulation protein